MNTSPWRLQPATEKQLQLIAEMQEFSEFPLPIFDGQTKGEASDYIDKWAKLAHETIPERDDYGDSV